MKIGEDSVVMGNVPSSTNVGDRSVVVGTTDANGNTIHNQPMAVGYGAKAGPGSIAIGAHANAGVSTESPLPTKNVQKEEAKPAPDHWYKKPIGVIGIAVASGVLLFLALSLLK